MIIFDGRLQREATPEELAAFMASLPESPGSTEADYANAVQAMMDDKARQRQYDNIQSAISYRGDANAKFATEAEALFTWRSAVWTFATAQLAAVTAGSRTQPTVADFVDEVQTKCPFSWPVIA